MYYYRPEHLITLLDYHTRIADLCGSFFERRYRIREDDHKAFMCFAFGAKQFDHLEAVRILVDTQKHDDAGSIARLMLEGMALLLWSLEREERALRWRAYALVNDLTLLRQKQARGEPIPVDIDQDALLEQLRIHAVPFLRKNHKDIGSPSSYKVRWLLDDWGKELTISAVVEKADPGLVDIYGLFCDWMHWNPRGLGRGIQRSSGGVQISWGNPRDGAIALISSFQSAQGVFECFTNEFRMKRKRQQLVRLSKELVTALGTP